MAWGSFCIKAKPLLKYLYVDIVKRMLRDELTIPTRQQDNKTTRQQSKHTSKIAKSMASAMRDCVKIY